MARFRRAWGVLAVGVLAAALLVGVPEEPVAAAGEGTAEPAEVGQPSVSYGGGDLQALAPARVLDTRKGVGAPQERVGAGGVLSVKVTGVGGVPAVGVGAVVLNLTGVSPTGPTYVTAWPHGADRPVASSLNLKTDEVRPNLVVVKVGRDGMVDLYNYNGQVDLAADVSGWFPDASGLQPLVPSRILDTRKGIGAPKAQVGSGATIGLQVTGRGGVPASGVGAVVVNLTGIAPSSETYLTAWPHGVSRPVASNLNLARGDVAPNLAVVKVGSGGRIDLFNNLGQVDVAVDVVGWFATGSAYEPLTPARVLDTRKGIGAPTGALGTNATMALKVTGQGGVPDDDVGAVVLNLTGIAPNADQTYITASPAGVQRPVASNLNLTRGQVIANLVVVKVGTGGTVNLYNLAGSTHLAADVVGWFPTGGDSVTTITPEDGTVLSGPGDVTSVTGDAETGGTVTFSASADVPAVGGHFAYTGSQGSGPGVSGLVTSSATNPDGTTTVAFLPANLQDIFADLEIHNASSPAARGAQVVREGAGRAGRAPKPGPAQKAASDDDGPCSVNGAPVSLPTISFGAFTGSADFSLRHGSARIEMGGTLTLAWSVAITGSVSCEVTLAEGPLGWIGPVEVGWEVGASVSVSAEATATTTVAVPVNVGFEYDDGNATNLSSADLNGTADGDANAELSAGFEGSIGTKLFGVLGVTAGLSPSLTVSLTKTGESPPTSCVTLTAEISVGLGAEAERWGVGWQFDIAQTTLAEATLYTSPDCTDMIWAGTITVSDNVEHHCTGGDNCGATKTWSNKINGEFTLVSGIPDGPGYESYISTVDFTSVYEQHDSIGGTCTLLTDILSTSTFPGVVRHGIQMKKSGSDWLIQGGPLGVEPGWGESGDATVVGTQRVYGCDSDSTTDAPVSYTSFPQLLPDALDENFGILMTDDDPDPSRLVGTTYKKVFDSFAGEFYEGIEEITITYDLHRVPVD